LLRIRSRSACGRGCGAAFYRLPYGAGRLGGGARGRTTLPCGQHAGKGWQPGDRSRGSACLPRRAGGNGATGRLSGREARSAADVGAYEPVQRADYDQLPHRRQGAAGVTSGALPRAWRRHPLRRPGIDVLARRTRRSEQLAEPVRCAVRVGHDRGRGAYLQEPAAGALAALPLSVDDQRGGFFDHTRREGALLPE